MHRNSKLKEKICKENETTNKYWMQNLIYQWLVPFIHFIAHAVSVWGETTGVPQSQSIDSQSYKCGLKFQSEKISTTKEQCGLFFSRYVDAEAVEAAG